MKAQQAFQQALALSKKYTDKKAFSGGGGEENKIDMVKVNGNPLQIDPEKSVDIPVPTKTSELENDSEFVTDEQMKEYAQPKGDYLTEIPVATESNIGGVKVDGETTTVDEDGTIHAFGSGMPGQDGKSAYQIAVDNGFVGDEQQWLASLKGEKGDKGDDGTSIHSISIDDNNNITVTYTNGKSEQIGNITQDFQADFLTEGGFGKLRYYNGRFQYFDGEAWIDTSVSPENVYIINMTPQAVQFIIGAYDKKLNRYKLKWKEPNDTIIDSQVACLVESVMIRRKKDFAPTDENDGELVTVVDRPNFGNYESEWFIDETLNPNSGDIYYYKAFPLSSMGIYNTSFLNATEGIMAKDYELYGFKIDQNESNPASMISYIEDNKNFRSAKMNYTSGSFDYGDWTQEEVFFMNVRPCMLNYDGTVAYYLNPNNYALREDGEASDITNASFSGNAMVQFPKIYWKVVDNGDNTGNVYISDKKVDEGFRCWSHIDANGDEIDYCYMPIYNGSNQSGVLRSLSGKTPINSQTVTTEINYAKANNKNEENMWYTEVFCDRQLVNLLLLLIGKSTDTQTIFGRGYYTGGSSASALITTGTMNTKGLFWGKNSATKDGVKVFGMEHYWGNQWRRLAGYIGGGGLQKVKMTYGQSDGSNVDGYNTTGEGYIEVPDSTPSGSTTGYCSVALFSENGIIPKVSSGSQSTYYTDGFTWYTSVYASVGSCSYDGFIAGALCTSFSSASGSGWHFGASISCKPLRDKEVA